MLRVPDAYSGRRLGGSFSFRSSTISRSGMKIVDWKVYTPDKNFHVFLELQTDTNLTGWGAAYSEREQVLGALGWLKRFVIGENPLEMERVTEKLPQITFLLGRG